MKTVRVEPFGDRAVLVTPGDPAGTRALAASLTAAFGTAAASVVPGLGTVLIHLAAEVSATDAVSMAERAVHSPAAVPVPGRRVVLPVRYDGEDLAAVADLLAMSVEQVIARHTAATYEVACLGFAPGFPYLTGLDPLLTVPRLDTPRTRVPAGSVGLAAGATCVYPSVSPGGWRLIGATDTVLFDPSADFPALLAPGDRVRFEAVR